MKLEECYATLRGSYAEAKTRLMSERIMDKFLLRFPMDTTFAQLQEAVNSNNPAEAFKQAHTLKGVAGNLAFTELYLAASELTEQLRDGAAAVDMDLYAKVDASYKLVIDTIKAYESEK